jgi:hypothetical protein
VVGLGGESAARLLEVDADRARLRRRDPHERHDEEVEPPVPVDIRELGRHAASAHRQRDQIEEVLGAGC